MLNIRPSVTYHVDGCFSYTKEDGDYDHFIGDRNIGEFVEHALMVVTPYTRVRITVEVYE